MTHLLLSGYPMVRPLCHGPLRHFSHRLVIAAPPLLGICIPHMGHCAAQSELQRCMILNSASISLPRVQAYQAVFRPCTTPA